MTRTILYSLVFSLFLSTLSCSDLVTENTLYGYDRGKKTFKLETRLSFQKYADAPNGFRYESTNFWGVGNKNTRKTIRKTWLNPDFSLRRSEKREENNQKITMTEIVREGDLVKIVKRLNGQILFEKSTPVEGPVFVEVMPEMFARDLKTQGDKITYPVLDDQRGTITNMEVRFLGPQKIPVNDKDRETLYFQLQAITAPDEYDNYFIDPESLKILQISFGEIRFSPE